MKPAKKKNKNPFCWVILWSIGLKGDDGSERERERMKESKGDFGPDDDVTATWKRKIWEEETSFKRLIYREDLKKNKDTERWRCGEKNGISERYDEKKNTDKRMKFWDERWETRVQCFHATSSSIVDDGFLCPLYVRRERGKSKRKVRDMRVSLRRGRS